MVTTRLVVAPLWSMMVMTSALSGLLPAVYAPVVGSIVPPEPLLDREKAYAGAPPLAVMERLARGAADSVLGATERAGVNVSVAVARLPRSSWAVTTSTTPPIAPAVYAPVSASTRPPELLEESANVYPEPLPPETLMTW